GFVHNEAVAWEVAARFYAARGFHKIADAYLRDARYCYLRWGADGKVRQLEELQAGLRQQPVVSHPAATLEGPTHPLGLPRGGPGVPGGFWRDRSRERDRDAHGRRARAGRRGAGRPDPLARRRAAHRG